MKIIGIEEHWVSKKFAELYPAEGQPGRDAPIEVLTDIGQNRIDILDKQGIDIQVLGHGMFPATTASLSDVQATNDQAADAVARFPKRFAAFAALPLSSAENAANELERTVRQYGFKGAMINGTIDGQFLDNPRFAPLLAKAESLDVPLYLHPAYPMSTISDSYYKGGFSDLVGFTLGSTAAGWHWEVGLHALRMIVSGVFDRYPNLQIIIGHLGELIPFFWERIEYWLEPRTEGLKYSVREYFKRNIYVTTSGYATTPPFMLALDVFGADRIIFSVDYPFSPIQPAVEFLKKIPVSEVDRIKIASGNVSKLLKL
ncbi:amidohydrolase family protein [Erwinia sorbitola]|uniref:Amidohydrolase family protein n=1 Tax=Erwinia sorbitola TaxID=2681984 RepID=A0A6I6E9Q4_9GAMM|nr:amidohydrolase family protein [Erwinia sorbitola]MTD28409.1 amidohydrolase family protein [Erwinia sorbitola]QGU86524.1 amidohydrolase family protein [Erwinia sorbitola]